MTTSNVITQIQRRKLGPTLDEILTSWNGEKQDTIKEFPEDVLVISCCIQRLAQNESATRTPVIQRYSRSLDNPELKDLVTDLDVQKAANIREYYKNKLIMLTLRDYKLTKFRNDLNKFLYSDPTKVLDSHFGLIYKLPYFFDYDKEFDDIFQSSYFKNNKQDDMNQLNIRNLTFVKKIENHRKHTHSVEYWFTDKLNKVMLDFPISNPLLSLLDEKINKGSLRIASKYVRRRKDLNEFFVCADKWVFA
jgi:hypothetical protein